MSSPTWCFDSFRLDTATACLWHGATPLPLPPKVFAVLQYLVTHPHRLVTKDELLDAVWPTTSVTDAVVRVAIGTLRKALGETAQMPRYIASVSRRGYRFLPPVTMGDTPELKPAGERPHATGSECGLLASAPTSLGEQLRITRAVLEGERKQVTVLCAVLQDVLALIRDLDPEAAQQLLDPALHAMIDAVHRYEGTVTQVSVDGIVVLFGVPLAQEDHALRACYAALAMQAALRDYAEAMHRTHGLAIQYRMGLHTGEVVVRPLHNALHRAYAAVGQTTHLAACLEQMAPSGTILLTATTMCLVTGLVRVTAWEPMPIKGLEAPVEVYALLGASGLHGCVHTATARGLTRFVGRQMELTALQAALAQSEAGHGQVVAVIGEAGVGKSRLLYEFVQVAQSQDWLVLGSSALAYGQATPYVPVRDLLRRYYHLEERDDVHTLRAKVTKQTLQLDAGLQDTIPALLALLDALPADSPFIHLDAPQRRRQTLAAFKRVLLRQSQAHPLVLVCEDLHWLDTETQALLESLIESLPTARLLLLVNYRPDYQHGWGSKTYYTQLRLDPLSPPSADAFLRVLLGDDPSLAPLTQLLIQRTQGNPFFLEESVRTLVETRALVGASGAYRLAHALPTIQVPASVQAVLAARIDRLPLEGKRLLQTAAVIGTKVPVALLRAIVEWPEAALNLGLTHLQDAEFLYEASLFPMPAYIFKHALTQEVAYGSLLHRQRRVLHARIVEAIEVLAGDQGAEGALGHSPDVVERLAHHAWHGEVWDKALAYCRQAGERAMVQSAYCEAAGFFEQALRALPHLPEQCDTHAQAIDLQLALRSALQPSGDSERMLAALREAEAHAEAFDDPRRLALVSGFLSFDYCRRGHYDQAITAARRALRLATTSEEVILQGQAHQWLGRAYFHQGAYHQAIACFEQTAAAFAGARRHERFRAIALPAVHSRAFLACCHAELGMFSEGRTFGEEGLRIAAEVQHPASLMVAAWGMGLLLLRQGDLPRALPLLEQAMRRCQDGTLPVYLPLTAAALGMAYLLNGRLAAAVSLLTEALAQALAMERVDFEALSRLSLGEAQLLGGRLEEAQALAERTLTLARRHQEHGQEAYALRLLGAVVARRGLPPLGAAAAHYHQALALAETLGMRPLQAHCFRGLSTLYAATGQRGQARAALSAAIEMYRSMAMTFGLPQAEATLAQVEAQA